ncbi:MAG TPA: YceI family protein [Terriglobia bacterium]|nr:YceI family protein [Terriglobia bacterium]
MIKKVFLVLLVCALPLLAQAGSQWTLEQSTLTYHISHPLHEADGMTHAARGKGICQGGECNFLVAAPVKTFDTGNSNRDLHMLEVVRGGEFPMVSVRFHLPESELTSATIHADLKIQFAGKTVEYHQVPFKRQAKGSEIQVMGIIPMKLSDFNIKPPSLLDMPIKNDVPVRVDTLWREQ